MITDSDREVAARLQAVWLDSKKSLRELAAQLVADVREAAYAQACRDCADVCRRPYSDDVQCYGPDEPLAVGAKLAAACLALASSGGR